MKLDILSSITRTFHKAGFQIKKHSPEILLAAGIAGTVASAVMACKATTKVNFVIDDAKFKIDRVHESVDAGETKAYDENKNVIMVPYSQEDGKKDLTIVYAHTALNFIKLYGPAITLGAVSVGCILASHNMLHKRNVALATAYAAVDKSFKRYRDRVIDRFGEDLDRELRYGIKAVEVEETVENEDGTTTVVKKTVDVMDPSEKSPYGRFFDETCPCWVRNAELNKFFLLSVQAQANNKLHEQGHLFLNEVYDMFGFPRTAVGAIAGWVDDPTDPDSDNYVDFGIFDGNNEVKRLFVNGYEKSIWLDFNVNGNILDRI
jgi:hypothetical protein